ncbi:MULTISPECIES: DUF1254 domain-containing protein [Pandoraea]|uniref:DUF1254 domain-containing protein n=1 Tax=Pandoraea TaxID=93217 RepID=UPI001F5C386B|nr:MULTISPECIES: DUF1254 domain-containing protein [Pandoraea]MCI3206379.1 carboxylesterase [Pandoraea sp. LA3]MDN4584407.1 carboxylesterase [Pandoraea capi]
MKTLIARRVACVAATATIFTAGAASAATEVTTDNFVRAESDLYFSRIVKDGGFGRFHARRTLPRVDQQIVVRLNRDTLYSAAVIDLDAGPATVTVPSTGDRYLAMQAINEDHYTTQIIHSGGQYRFTRETAGTRYLLLAVRILVDANDPRDLDEVHRLQDRFAISQARSGHFEIPDWDAGTQTKVRDHLVALGTLLPDAKRMFGAKGEVDPVRHLIGVAFGWGGNPEREAIYLNEVPKHNDGTTVYRLHADKVPVDGFWSVSVYNANGYFEPNSANAYTVNNVVAKHGPDGSVDVQFGGCTADSANCLPISAGWNYMVRLYRPQHALLDGRWQFPVAQPVEAAASPAQSKPSE